MDWQLGRSLNYLHNVGTESILNIFWRAKNNKFAFHKFKFTVASKKSSTGLETSKCKHSKIREDIPLRFFGRNMLSFAFVFVPYRGKKVGRQLSRENFSRGKI